MELEIILVHLVLKLQSFQVRNNLIFILFNLVLEIKVKLKLGKLFFGFLRVIDWRLDYVYPFGFFLHVSLYLFFTPDLLFVVFGFVLDRLTDFVLISRPDHQIFCLIIC